MSMNIDESAKYTIYEVKNKKTNERYIGMTKYDGQSRFEDHLNQSSYKKFKGNKNRKLFEAIQIYGKNGFTVKNIKTGLTASEANQLERDYIEKFDTVNCGYNTSYGGVGKSYIRDKDKENAIAMYKKGKTPNEIAKEFGVDGKTITKVLANVGVQPVNYTHCPIDMIDSNGNIIQHFESTYEACRDIIENVPEQNRAVKTLAKEINGCMKFAGYANVGGRIYVRHFNKILVDPPFKIREYKPVDMSGVPWRIDPSFY